MRVLFVHQNFPGQYPHIAAALAAKPGNEIVALAINDRKVPKGVQLCRYRPKYASTPNIHSLAGDFEAKVIRGEAAAHAAMQLKTKGFVPDVICGHHGWGELLFLRDVWPNSRILSYIEFFYRSDTDFDFDPEFANTSMAARFALRAKNANTLLTLDSVDHGITPTKWQWQQLPQEYKNKVSVIHDGIDTNVVRPNRNASIKLGRLHKELRYGDEIITFVNRNLEPYRGYHIFMRSLPEILKRRPKARAVIIGGDQVSYGKKPPGGQNWKSIFLNEVAPRLDMERVHLVGNIPYDVYLKVLQVSAAHVYLTYPFVLSWSMLEAMASECLLIGSATPPVQEVVQDGNNGLLVDFFSTEQIAETVIKALEHPKQYLTLRKEARRTIQQNYDLKSKCLPAQLALLDQVATTGSSETPKQQTSVSNSMGGRNRIAT
jgi:glycosyltransferase involved in cell wall biosynthesis